MHVDFDTFKDTLSSLASTLSITASIKRIMDGRGVGAQEALEAFKSEATAKDVAALQKADVNSVLSMTFISGPLLEKYAREAQACEDTLIVARDNAKNQAEKDAAEDKAELCMCSVLNTIKRRNGGDLPSEVLRNWWKSYGCKS